jgi:putative radical SAM enzyme (TIGR03279 family)
LKYNRLSGGLVSVVEPGALADQMGLQPGDVILAVNDHPLRDVIDFQFYGAEEEIELQVRRNDLEFALRGLRDYDQPWGVEFVHPTFDVDIRRCANKCEFCFVTQSPPGMRRTVYIKDDDYRYSFLAGHFVTLTNLEQEDWQRIEEQRLSPLHVSVHATELELRRRLLAKKDAPDVLEQIRWLGDRGIEIHTQLVLIPGLNDGIHLERSLSDLGHLFPTLQSISVVPIGLTRYHGAGLRTYRPHEAAVVLDQVEPWRQHFRRECEQTLVYPSDEWYLLARRAVPPAGDYDGFGQVENGVGMVRLFLDEWNQIKQHIPDLKYPEGIIASGELAAPVLQQVADELNKLARSRLRVIPIINNWYGQITVSGLLTGQDILEQLRPIVAKDGDGTASGEIVLLPRVMFDSSAQVTLDDMTLAQIEAALGRPVAIAQHPGEMLAVLSGKPVQQETPGPEPGWWGEPNYPLLVEAEP